MAVAHFAERYSLFVIICLGESIVAIGVGALGASAERPLSGGQVAAVALGLLITVAMWWTYFEGFAEAAAERLRRHRDPVLAAADAYSYLHLLIIAGIITFAVGVKVLTRGSVTAALPGPARLALCGGVALYLVGIAAFSLRLLGGVEYRQLAIAAALLALYAVGGGLPAWAVAGAVTALVGGLCLAESEAVRRVMSRRAGKHQHRGREDDGMTTHAKLELNGPMETGFEEVLTPDALEFVAELQRRFGPRRRDLLRGPGPAPRAARRRARCSTSCPRRARSARATGQCRAGRPPTCSSAGSRSPARPIAR